VLCFFVEVKRFFLSVAGVNDGVTMMQDDWLVRGERCSSFSLCVLVFFADEDIL
jgi:hypothetical protein